MTIDQSGSLDDFGYEPGVGFINELTIKIDRKVMNNS